MKLNSGERKKFPVSKLLLIISLVCLAVSVATSTLFRSVGDSGKYVEIPVKNIPQYGSTNQGAVGGWVYMDAVKIEQKGTATYTSSVSHNRSQIYVIWDKDNRQLVLTKREDPSDSLGFLTGKPDELMNMPQRIYGNIEGTARKVFSDYTGASSVLSGHMDDDVIGYQKADQEWLSSNVKIYVVDEEKLRKRNILDTVSSVGFVAAIILFIISRRLKKKEEIERIQEASMSSRAE